jgi:hypothetical protein
MYNTALHGPFLAGKLEVGRDDGAVALGQLRLGAQPPAALLYRQELLAGVSFTILWPVQDLCSIIPLYTQQLATLKEN